MPTTIDVPVWYAGLAAIALPAIGWIAATLRLTGRRDEVKAQIAELQRLTDWSAPVVHREAGHEPWPEPVSPLAHHRAERLAPVSPAPPAAVDRLDQPTEAIVGAHAAPPATPNWYRNEHQAYTWPWLVEKAARLASIGYRPRLTEAPERAPRHAAWNMPTGEFDQAVAQLVEAETKRQESAFARAVHQLMDDFVHMGGAR